MMCNSLEHSWVLSPNTLPNPTITLTLSSSRTSEMKRGSFSGLSLREVFPRSMLPPKVVLLSTVGAAARSHAEVYTPC